MTIRKQGTCFTMKARWGDDLCAEITLERRYRDWFTKDKLEDVFMYINPHNGFTGVELKGRAQLRKLANAILRELGKDKK